RQKPTHTRVNGFSSEEHSETCQAGSGEVRHVSARPGRADGPCRLRLDHDRCNDAHLRRVRLQREFGPSQAKSRTKQRFGCTGNRSAIEMWVETIRQMGSWETVEAIANEQKPMLYVM